MSGRVQGVNDSKEALKSPFRAGSASSLVIARGYQVTTSSSKQEAIAKLQTSLEHGICWTVCLI